MQSTKPPRPIGVTIIAILALTIAVIAIIAGAMLIAGGALLFSVPMFGGAFAGLALILAGGVLFFGLIWLLVGWGFLNGKGWARTIGLIFSFLGVLIAIVSLAGGSYTSIIGLVLWGLIIYYLFTGPVKAFFGKGPAVTPGYANPTGTSGPSFSAPSFAGPSAATAFSASRGSSTYTPTTTASTRFCQNCGSSVGAGLTKCSNCGASI